MPYALKTCISCGNGFRPSRRPDSDVCWDCVQSRGKDAPAQEETLCLAEAKELRSRLNKALRQVDSLKRSRSELAEAVREAVSDCMAAIQIDPVPEPKLDKRVPHEETAVAVLSDWQLAKVTPSYSSEICERRVEEYAEKVIRLTEIQRADHPVKEVRVYLLGDLVEGELIFPGQAHLIDGSLYRQVVVDGPRILSNFLRRMLSNFEKVHVVGVCGNHGALGGKSRKDYHPESNADMMMYDITRQLLLPEKRLTWASNITPGERHWYAVDKVGEKAFFLFHGDQIRGGIIGGYPWMKKIQGWAMGAIPEHFDYALAGHWHTPTRILIGNRTLWVSGSTESHNTYAAETLAAQGTPSQWLLFCHPKKGVTAEYQVHLT